MIKINIITYNIIYHPHLSETKYQISKTKQKNIKNQYTSYQLKSYLFFT